MGIQHHATYFKSILFGLLFALIPFTAQAYDSIFVVDDVKVDVTADNSVMAQDQAFNQAQVQAFETLTERMVAEAQAQTVQPPDMLTISSLVKDYEVTDEQISAVRYIGTYTFRFRENAVKKFFSVSGLSFTETSSRPLLVLPILQRHGRNSLWSEDNVWMHEWGKSKLSGGLVPVEVPIGDLMDISDIDEDQALSYERRKLDRMLERYDASEAAIMIAVPDQTLAEMDEQDSPAIGRLRISIYRTDRAQAEHVQDLIVESDGKESVSDVYKRGVKFAYQALQKDWKSKTVSHAGQNTAYTVRVAFKDLAEWTQIQQNIKRIPTLTDVSVLSVKKTNATMSFNFRGSEDRLRDVLRQSSFSLGEAFHNNSPNFNHAEQAQPSGVVYDLEYGVISRDPNQFLYGVEEEANPQEQQNNMVHTF